MNPEYHRPALKYRANHQKSPLKGLLKEPLQRVFVKSSQGDLSPGALRKLLLLLVIVFLTGCDSLLPPEPTATAEIDNSPTLAPSPTFLPIAAGENSEDFVGRNNPTAAALAAEGQPSQEPTILALPTESTIPLTVYTSDSVLLNAVYYGAPTQPAPVVLLLHGEDGSLTDLTTIAGGLQQSGYNVMLLTLRGYPPSQGRVDWAMAGTDVSAALQTIQTLGNIGQIAIVGQAAGAAAGLLACGQACRAFIALNPATQASLPAYDQLTPAAGTLPMMILADANSQSAADQINRTAQGDHLLQAYFDPATAIQQIVQWLQTHLAAVN